MIDSITECLYRSSLQKMFEIGSTAMLTNSSPAHARIVYDEFFKHAKGYVKIFCNTLSIDIFDNQAVFNSAKSALDRKVIIKCYVQAQSTDAVNFPKLLGNNLKTAVGPDKKFNFMVMDSCALRFESEKGRISAQVYTNNKEIAQVLDNCFELLYHGQ